MEFPQIWMLKPIIKFLCPWGLNVQSSVVKNHSYKTCILSQAHRSFPGTQKFLIPGGDTISSVSLSWAIPAWSWCVSFRNSGFVLAELVPSFSGASPVKRPNWSLSSCSLDIHGLPGLGRLHSWNLEASPQFQKQLSRVELLSQNLVLSFVQDCRNTQMVRGKKSKSLTRLCQYAPIVWNPWTVNANAVWSILI